MNVSYNLILRTRTIMKSLVRKKDGVGEVLEYEFCLLFLNIVFQCCSNITYVNVLLSKSGVNPPY